MAIYVISDLHFNSSNIIKYCNRPFTDVVDANAQMIWRWNSVVGEHDMVYVLGDFIMGAPETVPHILSQLNGHIHLVRGNHDTPRKLAIYRQYSEKVTVHDIAYLSYGGLFFVMCHFPVTHEAFLDMVVEDNSEVVVLHGHLHDKSPFFDPRAHTFNVSADVVDFTPQPFSKLHGIVKDQLIGAGVWHEGGDK